MAAAILEAHGIRTGAYLSPHLSSFAERIRIGDADLEPDAFGAAVERAAAAAAKVDRTLSGGERVTQFELLTAAAFSELAERGVEAAVVEAGLGGRHDATNVLAAPVAVLTNVGLEHTRWLGPTITDIAREKLAVVAPGVDARRRRARPRGRGGGGEGRRPRRARRSRPTGRRSPGFQRDELRGREEPRAGEFAGRPARRGRRPPRRVLAHRPRPLPGRRRRAPDDLRRRAQPVGGRRARLGAARRGAGASRSSRCCPCSTTRTPPGCCASSSPLASGAVFTASRNPRALSPATLASLWGQLGGPRPRSRAIPRAAVERAQALAGEEGAVVATGSIYLVADLLSEPGRRRASAL